jgi:hypothetical protein
MYSFLFKLIYSLLETVSIMSSWNPVPEYNFSPLNPLFLLIKLLIKPDPGFNFYKLFSSRIYDLSLINNTIASSTKIIYLQVICFYLTN